MNEKHSSLVDLRRDLHAHPEPGWLEFYTTARLTTEVSRLGYDVALGPDIVDPDERLGVPSEETIEEARSRAIREKVAPEFLDRIDNITGLVAQKSYGDGPTIGLRVDIDALELPEAAGKQHFPAFKGFASQHPGVMHACGHDGHAAIGVGVARELEEMTDFDGTIRLYFQPAEEGCRGGRAMASQSSPSDLDAFFSLHLGLGNDTGEVVAGYEKPLANTKLDVQFLGESSHAGKSPNEGKNALLAASTAITNLYDIERHAAGTTRINVGKVHSTNPVNVVSEEASMRVEIRADSDDVVEYMRDRVYNILSNSAQMYDTTLETELYGSATTFTADHDAVQSVTETAKACDAVASVTDRSEFGASEDVSHFINEVQRSGGVATYVGIGSAHPSDHHTPTFDIDEDSLEIGVSVLARSIRNISKRISLTNC